MPDSKQPHSFSRIAEELVGDLRGIAFDEPRRSKKRPTRPVSELVSKILVDHKIGYESAEQTIRDNWVALVGTANAAYSHAARLERNMLTVLVPHAVVRNELFHHRQEIVARIRKLRGCENVKALNLRAG